MIDSMIQVTRSKNTLFKTNVPTKNPIFKTNVPTKNPKDGWISRGPNIKNLFLGSNIVGST